jgi:hypothetical protein
MRTPADVESPPKRRSSGVRFHLALPELTASQADTEQETERET